MFQAGGYVFKMAESRDEFEQVHRLNYRTFVAEIPQHADSGTGRLVDKFHEKNSYFIALEHGRVVGMVSVHDQPPFSVADRMTDPGLLQRPGSRPLEVRLLAIEPAKRRSLVFLGLVSLVFEHAQKHGHTHLYISGVEDRLPMYRDMGFEPLGPALRCGDARFVPMGVSIGRLAQAKQRHIVLWRKHLERQPRKREPLCLLPGPVRIAQSVHEAFHQAPIYHRGKEFIALFEQVRARLGELVGGREVAVLNGSGTLANEVVAATLAADPSERAEGRHGTRGVMLVSGEFGQRLAQQAQRFGLRPRLLTREWGQPWHLDEVAAALADEPPGSWVWGVHMESSTGVLNDLPGLVRVAQARGIRVCVDCISSLGAVPIDLSGVYLATGATGKSIGSYAGAALIFADSRLLTGLNTENIPSYLDLPETLATVGPRYTFPSPTLLALNAALAEYASPFLAQSRFDQYAELGATVRQQLRQLGIRPLAEDAWASPVVTTFAPPGGESSEAFVARCREWGFTIGGQSGYLAKRQLVQIATMGAVCREDCAPLFEHLRRWLNRDGAHPAEAAEVRREPAVLTS